MASRQVFEGWCVFDPEGRATLKTLSKTRGKPKRIREMMRAKGDVLHRWSYYRKQGYTVKPVTVTVEVRDGE